MLKPTNRSEQAAEMLQKGLMEERQTHHFTLGEIGAKLSQATLPMPINRQVMSPHLDLAPKHWAI